MMNWIKLLRLKHWIKNLLVLFPILFAKEALNIDLLLIAIFGFFAFCFASSSIYIINDLKDIENDRKHPTKKLRPLASGVIRKPAAIVVSCVLMIAAIAITVITASETILSLVYIGIYIAINLLYSWKLKNVPVLDVAILSIGFVLRVLYGGSVCSISISAWLFLTTLALAIYLGLGKRLGELSRHGVESRESLKGYSEEFLKSNMNIFMGCGLIFYSLWTISRVEFLEMGIEASSTLLVLSVLLAMFILLRYNYLIDTEDNDADPVEVVTKDKSILGLISIWCILMVVALYC